MQIRLTVLGPLGGSVADVLVTAPAGTPLAAVASDLAASVAEAAASSGTVVLYAGGERLDIQRSALGEPPLVDGAVLSLGAPAVPGRHPGVAPETGSRACAQLHVMSGPDAGGVHLLHGGEIRIGRSGEADVPLDDPDVSRLHCTVAVGEDGRVTVTDLGSTNGTTLDGEPVGGRPEPVRPGGLVRIGESVLRLHPAPDGTGGDPGAGPIPRTMAAVADGEGHLRIERAGRQAGLPAGAATEHTGPEQSGRERTGPETAGLPGGSGAAGGGPAAGGPARDHPADGGPGQEARRGLGVSAWARWLTAGRAGVRPGNGPGGPAAPDVAATLLERWPDPATVLLTVLGPGRRLWERDAAHDDAMVVRLGTAHRSSEALPAPVTVGLRQAGSLGLAGPRARLTGLARSVVAQLAALHSPGTLEIVLIDAGSAEAGGERPAEWSWLGWLPQVRPSHGQDCRLLFARDREQAEARVAELVRRLDDGPLGPGWADAGRAAVAEASAAHRGPYSLVIVDGDPGTPALRTTLRRIAANGPSAGVHLLCLAETPAASPASPVSATFDAARQASPAFGSCGAVAMLSGDVATALRVLMPWPSSGDVGATAPGDLAGPVVGNGVVATVDAVSPAWAERFARALAPLRAAESGASSGGTSRRVATTLPRTARLLDELGLARATPASLTARWAEADDGPAERRRLHTVLGAGPHGPLTVDLAAEGPHLLVEGGPGTGKTELLRALAASLAAGDRPDRVSLVLVDGRGAGSATVPEPRSSEGRGESGHGAPEADGLRPCTDLPHVSTHLTSTDPVRMRAFAQSLTAELKRRAELLGDAGHDARPAAVRPEKAARVVTPRRAGDDTGLPLRAGTAAGSGSARPVPGSSAAASDGMPRLVVLVDDFDALVDPALGSTGRPAAGSVVRALEAVARDGAGLGVHLIAASGHPERTAQTAAAQRAGLCIRLEVLPQEESPRAGTAAHDTATRAGRGLLICRGGRTTPFQTGRVSGRIPRTSTLRPTVVPLDWDRAGDPPARRPLRELGNGPTDLALLASAMQRAALTADAQASPPLG
ncbi:FtsK/SpoIIIE domain-containing protein [Streptomyces meridianus]|uniref:FtsK/SpoIIIE domain-containing protein n=1 Tax=Streptomyces meridianus TaxID=2938945 RepID=A0ABT0WZM9_9ACTN|nr:FHA domain-containing protein [Streptomyces meridianus]MCM2575770.1 FtsK/SpoIIIE domain-containing protein [Streptomyces meridianus]